MNDGMETEKKLGKWKKKRACTHVQWQQQNNNEQKYTIIHTVQIEQVLNSVLNLLRFDKNGNREWPIWKSDLRPKQNDRE